MYTYIYLYLYIQNYIYIFIHIFSKAPKGNGIGATGSQNPRAY